MRKAMVKEQTLLEELKAFYKDFKQSLEVYQELEEKYKEEAEKALKTTDIIRWENALGLAYAFQNKATALDDELERLEEIINKYE